MATIIGQSGAWQEILRKLADAGLSIENFDELPRLHERLLARQATAAAEARVEHARLYGQYLASLKSAEAFAAATTAEKLPYYEALVRAAEETQTTAWGEAEAVGTFLQVITKPRRWLPWVETRGRKFRADKELARARNRRLAFSVEIAEPIRQWRHHIENHLRTFDDFVIAHAGALHAQVKLVTTLLESEAGGAAAELEMIELLRALPDYWIVLNDVNLKSDRWIYFNGKKLLTAQLDHVAIGPTGVFVIETKNWSRAFTDSGKYFNPYEQVSRASYLCYAFLKAHGIAVTARGIIATRTRLKEKPKDSYAVVKRPDEVCGYLEWFESEYSPETVARIAELLKRGENAAAPAVERPGGMKRGRRRKWR